MRTALGAPLQNISDSILNRVISKNIQADLRKYKMSAGTKNRGASNGRDRTKSPAVRNRSAARDEEEAVDPAAFSDLSKEVSHYLSSLNTSGQNKLSLIRMMIIRCDENTNLYARLRNSINRGNMDEADHYLASLEEGNYQAQQDLKNEVSDGPKTSTIIGMLVEQLKREKIEQARGRSPGKYANSAGRGRSTSGNARGYGAPDVSKLEA